MEKDFREASPPKWATRMFRWYCRPDRLEELEGDLEESFYRSLYAGKPLWQARTHYWWNVIRCFRGYAYGRPASSNNYIFYPMLTNYLKVIVRNFRKQWFYSVLNISGLAIGVAAFLLIAIYVHFETSFDQFHPRSEDIYRLTVHYSSPSGYNTHFARVDQDWTKDIPKEIPEVQKLIRFQNHTPKYIRIGQEKFRHDYAFSTDKDVFEMFGFTLLEGDPNTALEAPLSVVISEKLAQKYFPGTEALGKEVFVTGYWTPEETVHKVTGVMKDLPLNTHLPVDMLFSFRNEQERSWWAYTYLRFQPGADPAAVSRKIDAMAVKVNGENALDGTEFVLQPLTGIHLHSNLAREIIPNGSFTYVRIFAAVGVFILALVVINFMNLSGAMSMARAREMGMRRILGAARRQIVVYSLTESLLCSLIAALAGLVTAILFLPTLHAVTGAQNLMLPLYLAALVAGLAVLTGLLGGLYPAVVISGFRPAHIIKSGKPLPTLKHGRVFSVKQMLLSLQFAISILLIGSALVARKQFIFMNEKNLGLEKEQVVAIAGVPDTVKDKFKLFKDRLEDRPGIKGVSACLEVPSREIRDGGRVTAEGIQENADDAPSADIQVIDHDFPELMGLQYLAGESIPESLTYEPLPVFEFNGDVETYLAEKRRAYIINETALYTIGWKSPEEAIGKDIQFNVGSYQLQKGPVVGVVKDFHQETLKNKVDPVIMTFEPLWLRTFLVKLETENISESLQAVEAAWNELFPLYPFEYSFLDELYGRLYENEQRQLQLLYGLSGLAVIIAFTGLFGLVAYSLKTRVKEIAIRKVLGAGLPALVRLVSREYLLIMLVGAVAAIPLSCFWVGKWLENFAYRIDIAAGSYVITMAGIGLLLLVTVALHTLRSGAANPAETLREE